MPLRLLKYASPYHWLIYALETAQNKKELLDIASVLTRSAVNLKFEYKLRIAAVLLDLRRDLKKKFGMFVIFGWDDKYREKYTDIPDSNQDIFKKHHFNIFDASETDISHRLKKTINFDGAILIDADGNVVNSGIFLENLHPTAVAHRLYSKKIGDLSSRFGFVKKVHTRHLNAIAASYEFKETTVFTVSEETGDFHIFEGGNIVYSTVSKEMGG